jgi:hypothetical protein
MITIIHQTQSSQYLIGVSYEKSAGLWYRQCFLWDKSCRKMHTIFSAVLRQQRKCDVKTSFGHSARSAVYYEAGSQINTHQSSCLVIMHIHHISQITPSFGHVHETTRIFMSENGVVAASAPLPISATGLVISIVTLAGIDTTFTASPGYRVRHCCTCQRIYERCLSGS